MVAHDTGTASAPVALVTGGARRIGAATTRALHGAGYRVVVHVRHSVESGAQLIDALNHERAHSAHLLEANLGDDDELERLASEALEPWGRLDLLVNNASTFYPTPLGQCTPAHWDDLVGSNLKAPLFLSQALLPALRERRGCIINLLDVNLIGGIADHPIYSAAKGGLAALTRTLAIDLAPEVRVNGVAPGAIIWPDPPPSAEHRQSVMARIPLQRTGTPEDIADAIVFLARAPYVTGQILGVDGGMSLT